MKKIFKYALAVIAAAMTISCSQFDEQDVAPEVGAEGNLVPMTISVGCEPTRVNIGDDSKSINWTAGDKLVLFEGTSYSAYTASTTEKHEFNIVEESINGTQANFTGSVTDNQTKFYIMYPYDAVEKRTAAKVFQMTLPSIQQLGDYNVDQNALLSIGYFVKPDAATLYNIVGFLRVDITFDDVTEVVINGNEISGVVKVEKAYSPVTSLPEIDNLTSASNTVTLLPKGEVFEKGSYWVALLPSTTPAGEFRVTFNRTSQKITTYTATKEIVVERNKGFFIADYKWEKQDLVITDAATLTEFLTNSSKYGKAEFANDIDLEGVTLPTAASFEGELDCKGFALKNWNAAAPLFGKLAGSVKNLVIDESCTLAPTDTVGAFGFVAATVASGGALENITNNVAAITLDATKYGAGSSQLDDAVYFGVLAGECYGTVKNCVNKADITISTNPTGENIRGMVYVGGLVGLLDNAEMIAADENVVSMSNCQNEGNIAYTVASGRGGFLFLGGLAGGTTASKLSSSTTIKAKIDGCTNTGVISNVYPSTATAIGAMTKDNSNYTYVAGVIGYCEGSVSNCVNGVKGTSLDITIPGVQSASTDTAAKGSVIMTTPTLEAGFVVANVTVAGVAGMAMTGGDNNINYAPITVQGSFGSGTIGTSQLGGGSQNGVSVAGVVGQTGASTNFKDYTLSNCHNHGAVTVSLPMADDQSNVHNVGGVVAYSATLLNNLTNNAAVNVESTGNSNYIGGVVGYSYYSLDTASNNANLDFELKCNGSKQLGSNCAMGGVLGWSQSGSSYSMKDLTNNNALTVTISGTETSAGTINIGGVAGKSQQAATNFQNKAALTVSAGTVKTLYVGGLCGEVSASLLKSTNHSAVTVDATSVTGDYVIGGLSAMVGLTTVTDCVNKGALNSTISDAVANAYIGGLFGTAGNSKVTISGCNNESTAAVNFTATKADLTTIAAGGIFGAGYKTSPVSGCTNSAAISLSAKSAIAGYLAGISAFIKGGSVTSTSAYGLSIDGCTNTGKLYANFPATWYVGGAVAFATAWHSTASNRQTIVDTTVTCDIEIAATNIPAYYVGGVLGYSGLHDYLTGNKYTGTITVGANADGALSAVGGLVGGMYSYASSATTVNNATWNFGGNTVDVTINQTAGTNVYNAALIGIFDNTLKSTLTSNKVSNLTCIFDTENANKIKATSSTTEAIGAYRNDATFALVVNGATGGVVVE